LSIVLQPVLLHSPPFLPITLLHSSLYPSNLPAFPRYTTLAISILRIFSYSPQFPVISLHGPRYALLLGLFYPSILLFLS
jgi:hypothetical protein